MTFNVKFLTGVMKPLGQIINIVGIAEVVTTQNSCC